MVSKFTNFLSTFIRFILEFIIAFCLCLRVTKIKSRKFRLLIYNLLSCFNFSFQTFSSSLWRSILLVTSLTKGLSAEALLIN